MKRLYIIGAGGFGREICALAEGCAGFGTDFTVAGFLDDRPDALSRFNGYPPVAGSVADFRIGPDDVFFVAIGDAAKRAACAQTVESRGGKFAALVHERAVLGRNVSIAPGAYVAEGALVSSDASLGRHAWAMHCACAGHDSVVGDFATVYPMASIGGGARIGRGASVYPGATVAPRVEIGEFATVGASSAAFLDVPARSRVIGVPAMPLE